MHALEEEPEEGWPQLLSDFGLVLGLLIDKGAKINSRGSTSQHGMYSTVHIMDIAAPSQRKFTIYSKLIHIQYCIIQYFYHLNIQSSVREPA